MRSNNSLHVTLGVLYVLGLNLGWVASDAINQVVMTSAFVPLFLVMLAAWSETLWFVAICAWEESKVWRLLRHALPMAVLWFTSSLFNLLSLHYTALSSDEAITTLMAPVSLTLSLLFIPQQRSHVVIKLLTVLLSVGGVLLIIFSDSQEGSDGPLGDGFAVISACAYAAYDVYVKKYMETETDLRPYLGTMGATVLITGFPVLLLVSDLEPLGRVRWAEALLMLLAALVGYWVADFCMAKAVLHLSPLAATLGATINVPVSVCIDHFVHNRSFTAQFAGGALLCVLAFCFTAALELKPIQRLLAKCTSKKHPLAEQTKENDELSMDVAPISSHDDSIVSN